MHWAQIINLRGSDCEEWPVCFEIEWCSVHGLLRSSWIGHNVHKGQTRETQTSLLGWTGNIYPDDLLLPPMEKILHYTKEAEDMGVQLGPV